MGGLLGCGGGGGGGKGFAGPPLKLLGGLAPLFLRLWIRYFEISVFEI